MEAMKLFRLIGSRARNLSSPSPYQNEAVRARFETEMEYLVKSFMPSGSGFDNGTTIDIERSNARKLVFQTGFHHMNETGMYDGWTHHNVIVTAEFDGLDIQVTGRDRNNIKEYIGETFYSALHQMVHSVWNKEECEHDFTLAEA
jgi:hypothetical protein